MNFFTKMPLLNANFPISYLSKIVSLGSCFAENMGEKLDYFKFQNTTNPFGILFNPVAIENLLSRAVNDRKFTSEDVFFHNEHWHSFELHSDWSNESKEELVENLNQILLDFKAQISQASHVIITYGTSWIYRLKATNEVVANCHKVPQNQFDKEILSTEILEKVIQNTLDLIQKGNPKCSVIFTVSPVRHLKDGFVENQRSKAHLITSIHAVLKKAANDNLQTEYFPSYEIMMDELRDYRFYAQDMLHPNQVAIDYIWERFSATGIAAIAYSVMDQVDSIQKGLLHKPFNPNSERHKKFETQLQEKITKLVSEYPFIKF